MVDAGEIIKELLGSLERAIKDGDVDSYFETEEVLLENYEEEYIEARKVFSYFRRKVVTNILLDLDPEILSLVLQTLRSCILLISYAGMRNAGAHDNLAKESNEFLNEDMYAWVRFPGERERPLDPPEPDAVSKYMPFLLDILNSYQRRIAYLCSVLSLLKGKTPKLRRKVHTSINRLENELEKDPWGFGATLTLGNDFRHIRNSLAHGSYVVKHKTGAVKFRDRFWKRELSYPRLRAHYLMAVGWSMGFSMARDVEVETAFSVREMLMRIGSELKGE